MSETHVPAQHASPRQEPRFPASDVHSRRTGHPRRPSPQGPSQAHGLSSAWRLRGRRNIEAAQRGRRSAAGSVWVRTAPPEPGVATPVVGYAIGRRVGTAVTRNRLRRRLRAIVAELSPRLAPGRYLIGAAPQAADQAFSQLRADVGLAFERAGAVCQDVAS